MLDDRQLLRRYAEEGSEAAFGEIVSRYVNLVYSAALRRTNGDSHQAQDVAQLVFTDLARKARSLPTNTVLAGWLHRASRYAAAQLMRAEHRRESREQQAVAMNALHALPAPDWGQNRPLLDEALDRLSPVDRDALLLRFFDQRSLAEVGQALGANEDAARKRVTRALEKLRVHLARRGVATSTTALSAAVSAHALQAAPAGLAATLTTAAVAGAMKAGGTFALMKFMILTKFKLGVLSAAAVAVATTSLVLQHQAQVRLRQENDSLRRQLEQIPELKADNDRLSNLVAHASDSTAAGQNDLLRLRSEVTRLRQQTNELARLRDDNRRLRQTLGSAANAQPAAADPEEERQVQIRHAKLNDAKLFILGFLMYANDNADQFPTNLNQAAVYLKNNSLTWTNAFDQMYSGSIAAIKNPATAIILRESQPWLSNGKWMRTYGFADGHSQIQSAADGNFDAFEKANEVQIASPPQ